MNERPRFRARPTPALLASLRTGKALLHEERAHMTLREKVAMVLELQRLCLPLLERRRQLAPWEKLWSVTP